jgi:hypothetical protein
LQNSKHQPFSYIRPLVNRVRIAWICLYAPLEMICNYFCSITGGQERGKACQTRISDRLLYIASPEKTPARVTLCRQQAIFSCILLLFA